MPPCGAALADGSAGRRPVDFLKLLTIGVRRGRIATVPDLVMAIGEGAAYLSQGSAYAYIRARSGTVGPRLMQDATFGAAMERCTWEGFAAFAADLILIVENDLRPCAVDPGAKTLQSLYRSVLANQDLPRHRFGQGWDDRIARFDRRVAAHLAAPPRSIGEICREGAEILLEYMPVTDDIRRADREMVLNNVQFRFIEHVEALRRRSDNQALSQVLTGTATNPS